MSQGIKGLFLLEQYRLLLEFPHRVLCVGVERILCSSEDVVRGMRGLQVGKHEGRDGDDSVPLALVPTSRKADKGEVVCEVVPCQFSDFSVRS